MSQSNANPRRRGWGCLAVLIPLLAGCGDPPPTPTLQGMYDEERNLPAVFLVEGTNEQVVLPGDRGVWAHEGKLCWIAMTCTNPDCPQADAEEPVLFPDPNPAVVLNPDGTIGYGRSQTPPTSKLPGNCPECLELRDLASETAEDRQKYLEFVRPYVLPGTEERRAELTAARKARQEELHKRMSRE